MAIDIIKDPVTGNQYSRDLAVPGSTYAPYTAPLSGTQAPAPPTSAQQSPILDFANALDDAVNRARQKRNESSLGMMAPFKGTVAASDFNSILSNLNRASDSTSQDLTNRALEAAEPPEASDLKILGSADAGYFTFDPATREVKPISGGSGGGADFGGVDIPSYEDFYKEYLQTAEGKALAQQYGGDNIGLSKQLHQIYDKTAQVVNPKDQRKFTDTEKKKLEQAGLLNASRQEQLDHLYGDKDEDYVGL